MSQKADLSLGDYFESLIAALISSGRYQDKGEVIRAGLRLLEKREAEFTAKVEALQDAITQGLESGEPKNFDRKEFQKQMLERKVMVSVDEKQAENDFDDLLLRIEKENIHICITRNGEPIAYMVPHGEAEEYMTVKSTSNPSN